jgi:phosphoglycolate phosphatase
MPRIAAVVFDLDGTLVDSAADLAAAVNAVLAERGRPRLDLRQVRSFIGDGAHRLIERALAATGSAGADERDAALGRFLDIYGSTATATTRPFPGTVEVLQALRSRGFRLGLCTNMPMAATRAILRGLDLAEYFAVVSGGDSLPVRKPDPRHLLDVLSALAADPNEAAMVGDNEHDAAMAQAAGVRCVLVAWGYARRPIETLGVDATIREFGELSGTLEALGRR